MKNVKKIITCYSRFLMMLVFCFQLSSSIYAQVPRTISYQGVLTDNSSNPITDGDHSITIRFYETLSAINPIYTEKQTVNVSKGVFNMLIGASNLISANIQFDKAYFLGISIDSGNELIPRTPFASAPYSLRSEISNSAESLIPGATGVVTSIGNLEGKVGLTHGVGVLIRNVGNNTLEIEAADVNPFNEMQTLSFDPLSNKLSISDRNSVDLSSLEDSQIWFESGANISNSNKGNVGIGTLSPTEKLEVNGEILVTGGNQPGFNNASLRVLPTNTGNITALYVKGTGASGNGIEAVGNTGVIGITSSASGAGVTGISSSKSPGVTGVANSDTGVVGTGITGLSGQGSSLGVNGVGVVGVYGKSSTIGGGSRGIIAEGGAISLEAIQNTSGIGIAVLGTSVNGLGDGLQGVSNGTGNGVHGVNSMSSGNSGFAGLFDGRVKVTGSLTMQDKILPMTNNSIDLGSSALRWRDVWCARNAFNGSDRRMKRNITTLEYGLKEVLKLNTYSYNWSDPAMDDGIRNMGVIAQEIREIMPELVREGDGEDKLMSVNYTGLIPILINAIKEQQKEIEKLKESQKMNAFTAEEIEQLKSLLTSLAKK